MIRLCIVAAGAIGLIVFVAFVAVRLIRSRTSGMSIRMQFFIALALIVGAFAFGLGVLVLDRVKARANLLGREAALDEAKAVAALVATDMKASGASLETVARKLETGRPSADDPELHLTLLDASDRPVFARGRPPNEDGTVSVTVPIMVGDRAVGSVRVVKPTLTIRHTLADFAPTVLIISLILGAVAAGAAARLGSTIARPIEELINFAERVSAGERRAPPPPAHGREVKRLSASLDSMRRELQGRPFVEAFAADLSHELKNPVAAIRASAEVLRDGAAAEPEEAQRFLARILESTGRIEGLLGDLLSLARLEARGIDDAVELDLREPAEGAASTARERGAAGELRVQGNVAVRGNAAWLVRAIENLLDNARIHGKPEELIRLSVVRQGDEVVCRVSNGGEVDRHVYKRIFRRFREEGIAIAFPTRTVRLETPPAHP